MKNAKQAIIAKQFASSIVDTFNPKASFLARAYSRILTGFYLSQIKGAFIDFNKSEFSATAVKIYSQVRDGAKKNEKNVLQDLLTLPNFELFKICVKNNKPLPYHLYPTITKTKIVHCRVASEKSNLVETETFAHVTVRMNCATEKGEPRTQLSIFERRMDIKVPHAWRVAFIEDEEETK